MFGNKIQQFYGGKESFFFEGLYQQVNRQALAPFFCPWLHGKGLILDAGSGSGHLAEALGLSNACFFDLTWEQNKRCRDKECPGHLIRGDIQQLRLMKGAHLLDLKELVQPNLQILDSSTVVFLPPYFQAQSNLLGQGLVAYVLKKLGGIKCLH